MTNYEALQVIGKLKPEDRLDSTKKLDALMTAMNALEKQIPMKPILHPFFEYDEDGSEHDYSYYKCPNGCQYAALTFGDNYCRRCGQAIDWTEAN